MKKISLSRIKKTALDLYALGQLPKELCKYIQNAKGDDKKYIELLKNLSEHYLRVKGYYKKYPSEHNEVNAYIVCVVDNYKKERGY